MNHSLLTADEAWRRGAGSTVNGDPRQDRSVFIPDRYFALMRWQLERTILRGVTALQRRWRRFRRYNEGIPVVKLALIVLLIIITFALTVYSLSR